MALGSNLSSCRRLRLMPGLVAAAVLLSVGVLSADTLTKTDGTVYTGKILRETAATVEMDVAKYGATFTMRIPRIHVRKIVRAAALTGPKPTPATPEARPKPTADDDDGASVTYYPLPITGRLGEDTQAETFATALDDVLATKPDVLVLYINSTGGSVTEAEQITQLLAKAKGKTKEMRIVAYVRRAQAAAAAVALWCPDICIAPKGQILAHETPSDDPDVVLDDAVNINAKIAEAARAGKHSELLVRGLTNPELELAASLEAGKIVIREGRIGRPIKDKDKPLVLVGRKAVDAGLAKGVVAGVHEMKTPLGIKKWRKVSRKGWDILALHARQYRAEAGRAKAEQKRAEAKAKRGELMARIAPELQRIDGEIVKVKARGRKAEGEKAKLIQGYNAEVNRASDNCDRKIRQLRRNDGQKDRRYGSWVRKARQERDKAMADAEKKNRPRARKIQAEINSCVDQLRKLQNDRKKLLKGT